jgi:acyl dehydratase
VTDDDMPALLLAEQLAPHQVIDLGEIEVERDEILAFASRWDPQPLHLDDAFADAGFFGEIIASGMHTLALFQRLAVLGAYRYWDIVAGRRLSEVQFLAPVRAGMVLHGELTITEVIPAHPRRSLVITTGRMSDEQGVDVLTLGAETYVRRQTVEA